jgi:hypothetical protein
MSIALLGAGILLVVASVRDKQGDLVNLVQGDLLGEGGFLQWFVALVLLGAIGFIPRLKPFSVALMALVLIAIFLRKGTGFFDQLQKAVGIKAASQQ